MGHVWRLPQSVDITYCTGTQMGVEVYAVFTLMGSTVLHVQYLSVGGVKLVLTKSLALSHYYQQFCWS